MGTKFWKRISRFLLSATTVAFTFMISPFVSICSSAEYPSKDSLYLGVYWAGEYTYVADKDRWIKIDSALSQLAGLNVNAIWLTHVSAADAAEFARRGARYGIRIVACLSWFAWEEPSVRSIAGRDHIQAQLNAYGDAPLPIAWGLGDEMINVVSTMPPYVNLWKTNFPGVPVTATFMWNNVGEAAAMGFDYLTCDFYPFFSSGNPNGPNDWASPVWWYNRLGEVTGRTQSSAGDDRPWMIPQGFQDPWGPFEVEANGDITYLPGGGPHWVMPTDAQIAWQAHTAVSYGVKGLFYFNFRAPSGSNPNASPCNLPSCGSTRRPSNAPYGLGYVDGRTTSQLRALGAAYGWIRGLDYGIRTAQPVTVQGHAWVTGGEAIWGTTLYRTLYDRKSGRHFGYVTAGYPGQDNYPVAIAIAPHILACTDAHNGNALTLDTVSGLKGFRRTLQSGTAMAFSYAIDSTRLPKVFEELFTDNRALSYASRSQNVAWYAEPRGISASNGSVSMDQAFLVFNVDSLLQPLPKSGIRVLEYGGAVNGDGRGVSWSASNDGQQFRAISSNRFNKPDVFREKYLRINLSFIQASNPYYGHCSMFRIYQWADTTAKPVRVQPRVAKTGNQPRIIAITGPWDPRMAEPGCRILLYNIQGKLVRDIGSRRDRFTSARAGVYLRFALD